MELKAFKTSTDYKCALERFESIFQAEMGTKESDEAAVLALLNKDLTYLVPLKNPNCNFS